MVKYIVSKGWEGFGDRIQCLSSCLVMALRFNRTLYVDWNDTIWSEGFYKYFYFEDVPYITSQKEIPNYLDVYPSFWQHKLMLPGNNWLYDMKDDLLLDPMKGYNFQDVWVHPGIGYREYNLVLLSKHMRVNKEIAKKIVTKPITDLPLVHLRGTDRKVDEYKWQELREKAPAAVVLSDDKTLIDRWMKESPKSRLFSKPKANVNHFTVKDINKHEMNLALLRDFFALASATEAHALNIESQYFIMARMLGKMPDYEKMFTGNPTAF